MKLSQRTGVILSGMQPLVGVGLKGKPHSEPIHASFFALPEAPCSGWVLEEGKKSSLQRLSSLSKMPYRGGVLGEGLPHSP